MSLTDLWLKNPEQLKGKHVQQIIAFAGSGKLKDGNEASKEFRSFLNHILTSSLVDFADQCMNDSFTDSGLVLQDIANQVGRRLGFNVNDGMYRGIKGRIGFDGLWTFKDGHKIIVEVKTTDAYRMNFDTLAGYRNALIESGEITQDNSSILVIVGRKDTGDLEAQVRGSKHAWVMRLISVDAIMRLMILKEEVEDPKIISKIHRILIPEEYTKLDGIIDLLFSTTEDIKQDGKIEEEGGQPPAGNGNKLKFTPVAFTEECVERIKEKLKLSLIKRSRATFSTSDNTAGVICTISRKHEKKYQEFYWFAFHPHQKESLENKKTGYVAFGCGDPSQVILIPFQIFSTWLEGMNITDCGDRFYWHVHIHKKGDSFILHRKKGSENFDVTEYKI